MEELATAKEKLINTTVQPLNELAERVVSKESEIDVISKALDELAEGLENKGKGLSARQDEIEELQTTVAGVLEQNKGRKISEA